MRVFVRSLIAFLRDYPKPAAQSSTAKAVNAVYELGKSTGFMSGYRQGVQDARRLDEIRGRTVVFPDEPRLRVLEGGDQ